MKIYNDLESQVVFAHNDLNATNFLLDNDNNLRLLDFEYAGNFIH